MNPDPSPALILRAINPQRWNQYAYAIDNPLSYTDPSGRDAIAVNFSGMVAGLGRGGIIAIHRDGSATYARFGPTSHGLSNDFGAKGRGEVQITQPSDLPKVRFDSSGVPTPESMNALVQAVATIEGVNPSTVRINYFQTSEADTIALDSALSSTAQAAATGSGPFACYNVATNNCASFTVAGLLWGSAITAEQGNNLSVVPNRLFDQLQNL